MSIKALTRQVDDVTVVDLSGRITLGEGSTVLRDTVRELLGRGQKKILLNLGDVTYIDSSGIATLIEVLKKARDLKKDFVLFGLGAAVPNVLKLTNLRGVFRVVDTEERALEDQ